MFFGPIVNSYHRNLTHQANQQDLGGYPPGDSGGAKGWREWATMFPKTRSPTITLQRKSLVIKFHQYQDQIVGL